jgi:cytochrome c
MCLRSFQLRAGLALIAAALGVWALADEGARGAAPEPPRGEVLFENRCARCHGMTGDGGDGLAPPLTGIVGRGVASQPYFPYSDALKARGGVWTLEALNQYIADPQAFAPGAAMESSSPDPFEREAMISYLETLR